MKERILEVLKNAEKPLRPGEIAAALGEDKDAVSKAIKELKAEENQHRHQKTQHNSGSKTGYSFHASPPMVLIPRIRGYKTGAQISVSKPVATATPIRPKRVCSKKTLNTNTVSSYTITPVAVQSMVALKPLRR